MDIDLRELFEVTMNSGGGPPEAAAVPPPSCSSHSFRMTFPDLRQCSVILQNYKGWILKNPGKASDVESFFKVLAYLLPGRIRGNSTLLPELLYSTANVVSFWHDQILQRELELAAAERQQLQQQQQGIGRDIPLAPGNRQNGVIPGEGAQPNPPVPNQRDPTRMRGGDEGGVSREKQIFRIQVCLTILEYFEVFLEVAARKIWGDAGRWIIVFIMQAVKACLRAVLLFYYKVGLLRSPALPSFDRSKYQPDKAPVDPNFGFILQRSGRVIRKLHASPPLYSRDWAVPQLPLSYATERPLSSDALLAEVIHLTRPLCHLVSLGAYGTQSWKPWLLSLAMDVTSLYLHGDPVKRHSVEQVELQRRTVSLVLYLLRSPFYDHATKRRLLSTLEGLGRRIPLVGNLLLLLAQAIPQWQGTYSYVWS